MFAGSRAAALDEAGAVLADGTRIGSALVVNAAGTGAPGLTSGLPIRKKKGHLVITERYPGFVSHQLVELGYIKSAHASEADSVAFNVQPRETGQVLLGSSRQYDRDDAGIDNAILAKMTNRAFEFMPALRKLTAVRVWTGFRPATPDNLPAIGRHPVNENLLIAAGHEGLGITTALGTAELIADEIAGRPSAIDRTPFSPARFFA